MSNNQESQVPWEEPMNEFLEHDIRQVIGIVQRGIQGLAQYLEGLEEWLPENYEFWAKHPDFKDSLAKYDSRRGRRQS